MLKLVLLPAVLSEWLKYKSFIHIALIFWSYQWILACVSLYWSSNGLRTRILPHQRWRLMWDSQIKNSSFVSHHKLVTFWPFSPIPLSQFKPNLHKATLIEGIQFYFSAWPYTMGDTGKIVKITIIKYIDQFWFFFPLSPELFCQFQPYLAYKTSIKWV